MNKFMKYLIPATVILSGVTVVISDDASIQKEIARQEAATQRLALQLRERWLAEQRRLAEARQQEQEAMFQALQSRMQAQAAQSELNRKISADAGAQRMAELDQIYLQRRFKKLVSAVENQRPPKGYAGAGVRAVQLDNPFTAPSELTEEPDQSEFADALAQAGLELDPDFRIARVCKNCESVATALELEPGTYPLAPNGGFIDSLDQLRGYLVMGGDPTATVHVVLPSGEQIVAREGVAQ